MNIIIPILFTVLSGMLMSIQPGVNSILGKNIGSAWFASSISFLVGTLALCLIAFFLGEFKSGSYLLETAKTQAWWVWTGGLLGAFVVTSALVFAPKLGAINWIVFFLFGQIATSIILERWGLLGFPEKPISIQKIIGLVLLLLSTWLVRRG